MSGAPLLLLLSVLQQTEGSSTVEELPPDSSYSTPEAPSEPSSGVTFRAALEVGMQGMPSGVPGGELDGFVIALPLLGVWGGEDFGFELGAPLRLRLLDGEPRQEQDFGGILRHEDWDERSDLGQLVRELRIGPEEGRFSLRAGPLVAHKLGYGHLVGRYDNQLLPDYHPAGAALTAHLGPARVELFASDVLAARLFASEVRVDIGRIASEQDTYFDRFHAWLSAAHDFGAAGGTSPALNAAQLGADAALHKGERLRVWALTAAGARVNMDTPDLGVLLGIAVEGETRGGSVLGGRLEARRQGGGFRFGLFGPGYELARFSGAGLAEVPLADERLPEGFTAFGEVSLAMGSGASEGLQVALSASGEYFAHGRMEADVALGFQAPGDRTQGTLRAIFTGLNERPRYSVMAEARHRFMPAFYGTFSSGIVHFPQEDGRLVRGFTAGVGVGVDFQR